MDINYSYCIQPLYAERPIIGTLANNTHPDYDLHWDFGK